MDLFFQSYSSLRIGIAILGGVLTRDDDGDYDIDGDGDNDYDRDGDDQTHCNGQWALWVDL